MCCGADLPDVLTARAEVGAAIREHLLVGNIGTGMPAVSISAAKKSKISAHGQGGVGKTTVAVLTVQDEAVRRHFVRIAWVSVGQTPSLMEMQKSIYEQLVGSAMEVKEDATIQTQLVELQTACQDQRWLLVLDDVWDSKHERSLNCIDPNSPSKVLVTTRIRGLLEGCNEMSLNLLTTDEAVDLLLRTGQIKNADDAATAAAAQIASLCGNLPLYLSICGGIILGYDGIDEWQTELVGMMEDDRTGVIDDSAGESMGERLVESSLNMLNNEAALSVFMALGVCPEDVLVAMPVVQLICGADADNAAGKASAASMRGFVKALLDRNLLQGSIANGVQMHDIVRDVVRLRLGGEDGIREKQRCVVGAFVSACPAGSWAAGNAVGQYAALALEQHMAEALLPSLQGDAEAQAWLMHPEGLIVANAATAIGPSVLEAFTAAKEAAGELVLAARVAWAARLGKHSSQDAFADFIFRATDLLEAADDASVRAFEMEVLKRAYTVELMSERNVKTQHRLAAVQAAAGAVTFASKYQEFMLAWGPGWMLQCGQMYGVRKDPASLEDFVEGCRIRLAAARDIAAGQARELTDDLVLKRAAVLCYFANMGFTLGCTEHSFWDPTACGGEATLVEACSHWTCATMGQAVMKANAVGFDFVSTH
jgi:hypothetical protein